MTDLGALCKRVYDKIEWQRFPVGFTDGQKQEMILAEVIEAIKDLFVVTGRATEYYHYGYIYEETEDGISVPSEFTYELMLDEEMYVLCKAQVGIFSKVRAQYNDLLGYTTNALTVTNADKPYAYITGTIDELEADMRRYYYKMVRFSHLD